MSIEGVTISCQEIVELMTDYLEGRLDAHERVRFERHMVQCPPCRDYLTQLRTTIRELGRFRKLSSETDVPPATRSALLQAFRTYQKPPPRGNGDE